MSDLKFIEGPLNSEQLQSLMICAKLGHTTTPAVLVALLDQLDAQRLRADTAEAEKCRLEEWVDNLKFDLAAAEQRIVELAKSFEKFRDVVRGCERLASKYSPCIDSVDEDGGDNSDDPTHAIFHRLYYAMFDADAALNPNPEAESHE